MSEAYRQLLDASIAHLEALKARGAKFVTVAPATLAALGGAPRPAAPSARSVTPAPVIPKPAAVPVAAPVPAAPRAQSVAATIAPAATISPPIPAAAPLAREAKEAAMADLRARALVCQKCAHLAASRQNVVFGVGNIHSPLMFVGEAPGQDEDTQGEPFVGAAGQLLTRIIQTMGLSRESVYIANILKCRPDTPGQAAGNRKPTPEEMKTCLPYLLAQIDIIRPKVIVGLGGTAVEGLLGKTGITKLRGNWLLFRDTPFMPTYHPSYLLRNQALAEKRRVWEDMLQVMERLDMPISEKQRNYFLKA